MIVLYQSRKSVSPVIMGMAEQPRVLQAVSNRIIWGVSSLQGQNGPVLVLLGTDPFVLAFTRKTLQG